MSSIPLPQVPGTPKIDTITRAEGPDTVHTQAMSVVNPANGEPLCSSVPVTIAAAGAIGADLFSIDASAFKALFLQLTGTWSGTVSFQSSNDGVTWVSSAAMLPAGGAYVSSATANGQWIVPVTGKFMRARATAYASGSIAASVVGSYEAAPILSVNVLALSTSTSMVGDVGVGARATTTNSTLRAKISSAASTNANFIKAAAGRLYGMTLANTNASWRFLRIYNKTTAPVVGTDIPVLVVGLPPGSTTVIPDNIGVYYSTGIAYSITGAAADLDNTAIGANDVLGEVRYA